MPYIYLVHCRASINANENVYKIGKSIDFNKRLAGYDKGTIPIFSIYVKDCDEIEKILIKIFETKFSPRKDYGNEYFHGDINVMIKTIMEEYEKLDLCYSVITTDKPNTIYKDNTVTLIKTKNMLTNKLNKINPTNIYDFERNINMNSQEYNSSNYYHTLQNNCQYVYETQSKINKVKYGVYLEKKCGFITSICNSVYLYNDNIALKLIERIKICI